MIDSFQLLDDIFDWCIADEEFCEIIGIDNTLVGNQLLTNQNNKLRREYQTDDVIKSDDVPFISYYFMHSEKAKTNWMVNIGDLYVDIYANTMYKISQISRCFRRILAEHMETMLNYEGQHYSGVNGVYKYRLIYNPLIDGV